MTLQGVTCVERSSWADGVREYSGGNGKDVVDRSGQTEGDWRCTIERSKFGHAGEYSGMEFRLRIKRVKGIATFDNVIVSDTILGRRKKSIEVRMYIQRSDTLKRLSADLFQRHPTQ